MVVTVFKQSFGEEVIGELSGLLGHVHAFGELVVYPAIVGVLFESILINNFLRYYAKFDLRILWSINGSVEVEVGEVGCHKFGIRCGEGAVDAQLDCFEGPRLASTIPGVVDCVATDGDACPIGIFFCWTHFTENSGVCDIALAVAGYILELDRPHCICACELLCVRLGWVLANTLAESSNLICV